MSDPVYDTVMAFHVLAAVIGFGALGTTGAYAAAARRAADPFSDTSLVRYFTPGRNWAARAIFLVPVLGGAMLAIGHGQDVGVPWPWIGLGLWIAATGVASARLWPGERAIQNGFAGPQGVVARTELLAAATRTERAAAATSLLFVAALVVMIWQPT